MKKNVGVKKTEKRVPEKALPPVKKTRKNVKIGFHGHFLFSREKKTLPIKGPQRTNIYSYQDKKVATR